MQPLCANSDRESLCCSEIPKMSSKTNDANCQFITDNSVHHFRSYYLVMRSKIYRMFNYSGAVKMGVVKIWFGCNIAVARRRNYCNTLCYYIDFCSKIVKHLQTEISALLQTLDASQKILTIHKCKSSTQINYLAPVIMPYT